VAECEQRRELGTSEIEEPVLEPQVLARQHVLLVHLERQRIAGGEELELARVHLDLARLELGIHRVGRARHHDASYGDHELVPQARRALEQRLAAGLGMEHHLREAVAIAQVGEQHAAVVARAVQPAHERHALLHVLAPELAAGVRAPPVAEAFELL
jgi:hypothetical protein